MQYEYKSLSRLHAGTCFMFTDGTTINRVIHKQRNEILYVNLITGKCRHVKGFVDIDKQTQTCKVRYVKIIDRTLQKLIDDEVEKLSCPF